METLSVLAGRIYTQPARKWRTALVVCHILEDLMFLSREGRHLGVAFQDPPGCQASSRGEAKDSAVLPSRDADILEPPSGVSGVKPPLHFGERARDCAPGHAGKEVPSHRKDGGVSGVSSSCGARGGFLARHGEDLREPLVRRQGSQVSLRVARRSE